MSPSLSTRPVLDGISFKLERGETKILLGAAGTGKTLILKLALGLIKPDSGRITVLDDEDQLACGSRTCSSVRRNIGMVFQESALFDSMTVEENVAYRLIEETGQVTDEIHAARAGGSALRGAGTDVATFSG